jgi:hypothetical protein
MIKVFYWQQGERIEHPEPFDDVDEAISFLTENNIPRDESQLCFAPDEDQDSTAS